MKIDTEKYKFKTEAHAHTMPVSRCSHISPEKMVELYDKTGIDTIAITNHFDPYWLDFPKKETVKTYLEGYEQTREIARKNSKINIILGMEIRFTENINDYVIYGIDEEFVEKAYDFLDGTIEKFYKSMKNDKNVILQAHPFRDNMTLAPKEFLDGIETFNMHPNHNSRVTFACDYAQKNNMLVCGGTDFHHEGHQGSISMNTKKLITDSFEFAKIIKEKDFVFDIHGNIILV